MDEQTTLFLGKKLVIPDMPLIVQAQLLRRVNLILSQQITHILRGAPAMYMYIVMPLLLVIVIALPILKLVVRKLTLEVLHGYHMQRIVA